MLLTSLTTLLVARALVPTPPPRKITGTELSVLRGFAQKAQDFVCVIKRLLWQDVCTVPLRSGHFF